MADLIEEGDGMVNITLQTIGPSPRSRLRVPSTIKVKEFRKLIAGSSQSPLENMKLVLRGNVLHDSINDDDLLVQLHDGESVLVAIKPKPPANHIQDSFDDDDDDDDDGEDLKLKLLESTSGWKRRLFFILRDKLKLPDMLLMAIFSLGIKTWAAIVGWFILAPVANRLDLGPLYIIATGFLIIFYNLGHRQPGDVRLEYLLHLFDVMRFLCKPMGYNEHVIVIAYSVFNEDFRELPGTLNADRLDRDIRLGQF